MPIIDTSVAISPIELTISPKFCRLMRTGAGVGAGIGSATAPDKMEEATRATAAKRTNIFICQRGGQGEGARLRGWWWGLETQGFYGFDDARVGTDEAGRGGLRVKPGSGLFDDQTLPPTVPVAPPPHAESKRPIRESGETGLISGGEIPLIVQRNVQMPTRDHGLALGHNYNCLGVIDEHRRPFNNISHIQVA